MKNIKAPARLTILIAAVALGAGSILPLLNKTVSAEATGATGLNDKITFQTNRSGSRSDIYIANVDGSSPAVLATSGSGNDYYVSWSPDATKFAFSSTRSGNEEIFIANADGSNPVNITNNSATDTTPAWSPDGSKIAFASTRNSNQDIYVMNADGSNVQRLTTDADDDYEPAWSPDGENIAFVSNRDGSNDIYVMNADGSNQTNLTSSSNSSDANPTWSPYGTKIAFNSDRGSSNDIYAMNADGSNPVNLTNTGSTNEFAPAWSPDGSKIAYTGVVSDEEVFVMNADGSSQTNITSNAGSQDQYPAWKPQPFPATIINSDGTKTTTVGDGQNYPNADYIVNDGETLIVNGTVGNVTVMSGGTLMGHGTVKSVNAHTGSHVAPGNSPGCLTVNGDVLLVTGSNLDIEIGGTTPCGGYDQIKANGGVDLNDGAKLNVSLYSGFVPSVGQSYTVIDNDGSDIVNGLFAGIPQGGSFESQGVTYSVTYSGGDGNDVVLTVTAVDASKLPKAPNTGFKLIAAHPAASLMITAISSAALLYVSRRVKPAKR